MAGYERRFFHTDDNDPEDDANMKSINLGSEWDEHLQRRLMTCLRKMSAEVVTRNYSVVGSQEVVLLVCRINEHMVEIESETYMGLTLSGDDKTVDELRDLMNECGGSSQSLPK